MLLCACWNFSCGKANSPSEYPAAVELVFKDEAAVDSLMQAEIFKTRLEPFRWKNHLVFFGNATEVTRIAAEAGHLPLKDKKLYTKPLYAYDKTHHCQDTTTAATWRHYLLTANLVADTALQREYLRYHEKQFTEWPEVAQGFCHAGFQQLLVFREGRQLMLVISIPADRTLDELNPKTTEHNPRMVEWNQQMGRYQEGIAGTAPGEVWVFLEPF